LFLKTIKDLRLSKSSTLFFVKQGVQGRFYVAHFPTNVERKVFMSFEIPTVVVAMRFSVSYFAT
jgi:hypothetical protein